MDHGIAVHLVDAEEVLARIGKQLTVCRVINRFHAKNFGGYGRIMLFCVTYQLKLGRAAPDDENLTGDRDSLCLCMQIVFVSAAVA